MFLLLLPDQYLKTPSVSTPLSQPTSLNEVSKDIIHASVCINLGWPALQAHEPEEHLVLPGPR